MLAIAESAVQVDQETKIQIMQYLMNEDPYADILQQFQQDRQCREITRQNKTYRLKRGSLVIHDSNQTEGNEAYWKVVIPDKQEIKTQLLKEIHCVPYSGHPGFTRTLEVTRRFFYWSHMVQEVRQFVLDCPVCQTEKGSHLKPAGKLMPLEIPTRKWGPGSARVCGRNASSE